MPDSVHSEDSNLLFESMTQEQLLDEAGRKQTARTFSYNRAVTDILEKAAEDSDDEIPSCSTDLDTMEKIIQKASSIHGIRLINVDFKRKRRQELEKSGNKITQEYSQICIDSMDKIEDQRQTNLKFYKEKYNGKLNGQFDSLIRQTQNQDMLSI